MAQKYIGSKLYLLLHSERGDAGYDQTIYSCDITGIDDMDNFQYENFKIAFQSPHQESSEPDDVDEDKPTIYFDGEDLAVDGSSLESAWTSTDFWCVSPEGITIRRSFPPLKVKEMKKYGSWNHETYYFFHDHGASEKEKGIIAKYKQERLQSELRRFKDWDESLQKSIEKHNLEIQELEKKKAENKERMERFMRDNNL